MERKSQIYQFACCALMAALMCIFGPMSVPIGPVPVSLTNLVIYFTVYLIGMKGATVSYLIYMLLGIVGLSVFSGYQGGLAKVAGPTGGYLVGFILMALICGFVMEKSNVNIPITVVGMIVGTLVAYAFGTVWFVQLMDVTYSYALTVCVFPFIPFDLAKIGIATVLGKVVRMALIRANLITAKMVKTSEAS